MEYPKAFIEVKININPSFDLTENHSKQTVVTVNHYQLRTVEAVSAARFELEAGIKALMKAFVECTELMPELKQEGYDVSIKLRF